MEQATARLRKTFQYNADADADDDDDLPEALDEQEQTHLISTLQSQHTRQNAIYTTALLFLPLLCIPVYIPSLFPSDRTTTANTTTTTNTTTAMLSVLSISSLCTSAYVLWYVPELPTLPVQLPIGIRSYLRIPGAGAGSGSGSDRRERERESGRERQRQKGPAEKYLPWLNAVAVVVVAVAGVVGRGRRGGGHGGGGQGGREEEEQQGLWLAVVPGLVYGVVVVAKRIMGSVDVEGELEGLKYGYKGA